ncbi:MAG: hypothetical protein NVSMB47_10870 [Polyangiales bacterium]
MRLVFFGLPLAALALHRAGHEVALAAVCRRLAPGTRRLRRTLGAERVLVLPRADARSIVRRIRAAAPYPGAWTFVGDEAVVVTHAEAAEPPRGLLPGEGAIVGERAVVAAGRGAVALLRGRVVDDDDGERAVNAAEIATILAATKVPAPSDSG